MKIFISMPSADGTLHVSTSHSITAIRLMLQKSGIGSTEGAISNSEIVEARNIIAHGFLQSDATHLLTIDADMKVDQRVVKKLIEFDQPFIGVATPSRSIDFKEFYENARKYDDFRTAFAKSLNFVGKFSEKTPENDDFLKADYVGDGLLLISREVFSTIIESGEVDLVGPRHMIADHHTMDFSIKSGVIISATTIQKIFRSASAGEGLAVKFGVMLALVSVI